MEMDMVQSMYDSYELVSEDPFPVYTVLLAASSDDPTELQVSVSYPNEEYPEAAPCVVVAESISKQRRVQVASINRDIAAMLEENVGMHTVVMALQQLQEFLTNFAEEEEKAELIRKGEAIEAAAVAKSNYVHTTDPTIRLGNAVTRELFAEWSSKRKAERAKKAAAEAAKNKKLNAGKLTGKQLWDNTVASAEWELFGGVADGEDGAEDLDFDTFDPEGYEDYDLEDDEEI